MSKELGKQYLQRKERIAQRLYESKLARELLVEMCHKSFKDVPGSTDVALVLGTSLALCPDKFKKRVYTATQLQLSGKVGKVIFSGSGDHEVQDENQAMLASEMAIEQFGLSQENAILVGGVNTKENIEEAREALVRQKAQSVFVVSDARHLIRSLPLARYECKRIGVAAYPFPIPGEEILDPDDPSVILETIKAVLYNRLLNKSESPLGEGVREHVDEIVSRYAKATRTMGRKEETSFSEWRLQVDQWWPREGVDLSERVLVATL